MDKVLLQILGISSGHTSTSYTLILEEDGGNRKLPIIIGAFEAQAIAIEIEKITPVRPMTHDLIRQFADSFNITVSEVLIHRLKDGVFFANIVCTNGISTEEIDARTSDAIAIALRFKCPIYTYESIMKEAAIVLDEAEPETSSEQKPAASNRTRKSSDDLGTISPAELEDRLTTAIDEENYILAAKIRDEMKRREEK